MPEVQSTQLDSVARGEISVFKPSHLDQTGSKKVLPLHPRETSFRRDIVNNVDPEHSVRDDIIV